MAEVYIDTGDKTRNEHIFDRLEGQRKAIEEQFGTDLTWERLDTKRACHIAVYRDGGIDDES